MVGWSAILVAFKVIHALAFAMSTNLAVFRLDHLGTLSGQERGHTDPLTPYTHIQVLPYISDTTIWKSICFANFLWQVVVLCQQIHRWFITWRNQKNQYYRLQGIITRCSEPNRTKVNRQQYSRINIFNIS